MGLQYRRVLIKISGEALSVQATIFPLLFPSARV